MKKSPHPIDVQIGMNMRRIRRACEYSQEKVGNEFGITHQQIHYHEKGVSRISASRIAQLARFFDVPISEFFVGIELPGSDAPPDPPVVNEDHLTLTVAFNAIKSKQVQAAAVRAVVAMSLEAEW